jgi:hypothetical protein
LKVKPKVNKTYNEALMMQSNMTAQIQAKAQQKIPLHQQHQKLFQGGQFENSNDETTNEASTTLNLTSQVGVDSIMYDGQSPQTKYSQLLQYSGKHASCQSKKNNIQRISTTSNELQKRMCRG